MTFEYTFTANMSCVGCKNAIERILGKNGKFTKVDANWETKEFKVWSDSEGLQDEIKGALAAWCEANDKEVSHTGTTSV